MKKFLSIVLIMVMSIVNTIPITLAESESWSSISTPIEETSVNTEIKIENNASSLTWSSNDLTESIPAVELNIENEKQSETWSININETNPIDTVSVRENDSSTMIIDTEANVSNIKDDELKALISEKARVWSVVTDILNDFTNGVSFSSNKTLISMKPLFWYDSNIEKSTQNSIITYNSSDFSSDIYYNADKNTLKNSITIGKESKYVKDWSITLEWKMSFDKRLMFRPMVEWGYKIYELFWSGGYVATFPKMFYIDKDWKSHTDHNNIKVQLDDVEWAFIKFNASEINENEFPIVIVNELVSENNNESLTSDQSSYLTSNFIVDTIGKNNPNFNKESLDDLSGIKRSEKFINDKFLTWLNKDALNTKFWKWNSVVKDISINKNISYKLYSDLDFNSKSLEKNSTINKSISFELSWSYNNTTYSNDFWDTMVYFNDNEVIGYNQGIQEWKTSLNESIYAFNRNSVNGSVYNWKLSLWKEKIQFKNTDGGGLWIFSKVWNDWYQEVLRLSPVYYYDVSGTKKQAFYTYNDIDWTYSVNITEDKYPIVIESSTIGFDYFKPDEVLKKLSTQDQDKVNFQLKKIINSNDSDLVKVQDNGYEISITDIKKNKIWNSKLESMISKVMVWNIQSTIKKDFKDWYSFKENDSEIKFVPNFGNNSKYVRNVGNDWKVSFDFDNYSVLYKYNSIDNSFKEAIVVNSKQDTLFSWNVSFSGKTLDIKKQSDWSIDFIDKDKKTSVMNIPAPFYMDINNIKHTNNIEWHIDDNFILLKTKDIDTSEYPIVIDPSVDTMDSYTNDTFLANTLWNNGVFNSDMLAELNSIKKLSKINNDTMALSWMSINFGTDPSTTLKIDKYVKKSKSIFDNEKIKVAFDFNIKLNSSASFDNYVYSGTGWDTKIYFNDNDIITYNLWQEQSRESFKEWIYSINPNSSNGSSFHWTISENNSKNFVLEQSKDGWVNISTTGSWTSVIVATIPKPFYYTKDWVKKDTTTNNNATTTKQDQNVNKSDTYNTSPIYDDFIDIQKNWIEIKSGETNITNESQNWITEVGTWTTPSNLPNDTESSTWNAIESIWNIQNWNNSLSWTDNTEKVNDNKKELISTWSNSNETETPVNESNIPTIALILTIIGLFGWIAEWKYSIIRNALKNKG